THLCRRIKPVSIIEPTHRLLDVIDQLFSQVMITSPSASDRETLGASPLTPAMLAHKRVTVNVAASWAMPIAALARGTCPPARPEYPLPAAEACGAARPNGRGQRVHRWRSPGTGRPAPYDGSSCTCATRSCSRPTSLCVAVIAVGWSAVRSTT